MKFRPHSPRHPCAACGTPRPAWLLRQRNNRAVCRDGCPPTKDTRTAETVVAEHGHTLPDRHLTVAILRAVHPYATFAQLAVMCGLTRDAYAGIWGRLNRQHGATP